MQSLPRPEPFREQRLSGALSVCHLPPAPRSVGKTKRNSRSCGEVSHWSDVTYSQAVSPHHGLARSLSRARRVGRAVLPTALTQPVGTAPGRAQCGKEAVRGIFYEFPVQDHRSGQELSKPLPVDVLSDYCDQVEERVP